MSVKVVSLVVFQLCVGLCVGSAGIKSSGLHCYHGYRLHDTFVQLAMMDISYMRCVQQCLVQNDPTADAPTAQCKMVSFSGSLGRGECLHSVYAFPGTSTTVYATPKWKTCMMHQGVFIYQPTPNVYETAFVDAPAGCSSLGPGIRLASFAEVTDAHNRGFGRCNEVWTTDGNVYHILKVACGGLAPGIHLRAKTVANVVCIGGGMADIRAARNYDNYAVFVLN